MADPRGSRTHERAQRPHQEFSAGRARADSAKLGRKGPNKAIEAPDLEKALGPEKIEWLAKETGMKREELLKELSRELPQVVDKLTPEGRIPTEQEVPKLVGAGTPARAS